MSLKLGVIGTSWISKQFIEAAVGTGFYVLKMVYSRSSDRGENFLKSLDMSISSSVTVTTSLENLLSNIDVVYIASPNSLHYEQVLIAIKHNVHVIVEKPAVSNVSEFDSVMEALRSHINVKYFEAARHIHQPVITNIRGLLKDRSLIDGATFFYQKYSSKFDDFLNGKKPNVLQPEFSGGALYDLGVYTVYLAVALFGVPRDAKYQATKLDNGIDGRGTAVLSYDRFDVTLIFGKNSNSYAPSEIYLGKKTIILDNAAELTNVVVRDGSGDEKSVKSIISDNPMTAEASDFAKVMLRPDENNTEYLEWLSMSSSVNKILYDLRKSAAIEFGSDIN